MANRFGLFFALIFMLMQFQSRAQTNTGTLLLNNQKALDGYTLFSPLNSRHTYLINNCGELINQWTSEHPSGLSVYLLTNGSILRTGKSKQDGYLQAGKGGVLEIRDWNNQQLWSWEYCFNDSCLHHDAVMMPNGNILAILAVRQRLNEVLLAGKDTSKYADKNFWSESILEIKPIGKDSATIVWRWNAWDYLIQDFDSTIKNYGKPEHHPERINVNYSVLKKEDDLFHINSIDYNEDNNQILLSVRNYNEIWGIEHDHVTDTKQAKQNGLIFRWGNPATHGINQPGLLEGQHHAKWVRINGRCTGEISIFNNGIISKKSSVYVIKPNLIANSNTSNNTDSIAFMASHPTFFSSRHSSFQVLNNHNLFICDASKGSFIELTPQMDTVWKYISPVSGEKILSANEKISGSNAMFSAIKYPYTFTAFANKNCLGKEKLNGMPADSLNNCIPIKNQRIISCQYSKKLRTIKLQCSHAQTIKIINKNGKEVVSQICDTQIEINTKNWAKGKYIILDASGNERNIDIK